MYIIREGSNTIGIHFVAYRARYYGRGHTKTLEMVEGGPQRFNLLFGNQIVASTNNGIITVENFLPEALKELRAKMRRDTIEKHLNEDISLFNFTAIKDVYIETDEPTDRQNYFIKQTWMQILKKKEGTEGKDDLDYVPHPCIRIYNLISGDPSSHVHYTRPLECVENK